MAPTVAKAASSSSTPSGTRAQRFAGTYDDLGVVRVLGARAGDAVADGEAGGQLADGEHHAGRAVADGRLLLEPRLDRLVGLQQAVLAHLVQHLLDLVRPRARLGEQATSDRDRPSPARSPR